MEYMEQDSAQKNVYLIGDTVRYSTDWQCGYGIFVMDELEGEAYVYSPQDDCRSAEHTLRYLHEWARNALVDPESVAVVHWNNGLWDVQRILGDEPITPLAAYAGQIARIHQRIRRLFPNAQIIFATTTAVLESDYGDVRYRNADIEAYNRAALCALGHTDVKINDLYAATRDFGEEDYQTDSTFSLQASMKIGRLVAQSIRECLRQAGA